METDNIIKRLRWIMVGVIFVDGMSTLLGQPHAYWKHPSVANEFTPIVHFFATKGYAVCIVYWLIYSAGAFFVVSLLPRRLGLIAVFSFIFPHYLGATSWWEYRWNYGWWNYHWNYGASAATIYGIALSVLVVMAGFPCSQNAGQMTVTPNKSPEPTAVGVGSSAVAVHVASRRWLSFFR